MKRGILMVLTIVLLTSCTKKKEESGVASVLPDSVYIQQGDQLIAQTFDTLRNSLTAAIGAGGFAHAVTFCNEKAYPLTATYATEGITVRRASVNYRNPGNAPDSLEQAVLTAYAAATPAPRLIRTKEAIHYIKPIILQGMCLNCHGKPGTDIQPQTLAAIQAAYPDDRAVNYAAGDLRGIWHIAFARK